MNGLKFRLKDKRLDADSRVRGYLDECARLMPEIEYEGDGVDLSVYGSTVIRAVGLEDR